MDTNFSCLNQQHWMSQPVSATNDHLLRGWSSFDSNIPLYAYVLLSLFYWTIQWCRCFPSHLFEGRSLLYFPGQRVPLTSSALLSIRLDLFCYRRLQSSSSLAHYSLYQWSKLYLPPANLHLWHHIRLLRRLPHCSSFWWCGGVCHHLLCPRAAILFEFQHLPMCLVHWPWSRQKLHWSLSEAPFRGINPTIWFGKWLIFRHRRRHRGQLCNFTF